MLDLVTLTQHLPKAQTTTTPKGQY